MKRVDVVVLGGGISGLSAAWFLRQRMPEKEVLLIEQKRLGGWIETKQPLVEQGPRTFSSSRSPHLLRLIQELGLQEDLLFSSPFANKRYLWHQGKLHSLGALARKCLGELALEPFRKPSAKEETIYEFAVRRFGRNVAELFFDPLTLGIYAGDFRELSLQSCFPSLAALEEEYGSVVYGILRRLFKTRSAALGQKGLFTLKHGMQTMIDALAKPLQEHILLGESVRAISFEQGMWKIETARQTILASTVFCALPAPVVKCLFPCMPNISHASLDLVHVEYSSSLFPRGYGYLVPTSAREPLLGMIFDSEVFPQQFQGGKATAMIRPTDDPLSIAEEALSRHLGLGKPQTMWARRIEQAIPHYQIGHRQSLQQWMDTFRNLYFLGNYVDGASVDHCIERALISVLEFVKK